MPKSRQRWVTKLVDLFEGIRRRTAVDALARGQLARVALALQPLFATAQRGAALKVV